MAKKIEVPLSKADVKKTNDWLASNQNNIPEGIYKNLSVALKCCEAVDHLKLKIKDMVCLLSQHMGLSSKSEKGRLTKHFRRA